MKILVTGGAGFVGTNLIKRLLKEGHEVHSLDNYSTGLKVNEVEGCKYWSGNIQTISTMYNVFVWVKILLPYTKLILDYYHP